MDNLKNLTIIIVTYKTEKRILYNCIKSIDANIKIIVVENSNNEEFKSQVLKDFENVDVILSNTNLGYSHSIPFPRIFYEIQGSKHSPAQ